MRSSRSPRLASFAVGGLLLIAGGCSFLHSEAAASSTTASSAASVDVVVPAAAGRQSSGTIRNDVVGGETTAIGTSRGGDFVVRHGFYPPSSPSAPTGTN